jgi:integrase
MLTQPQPYGYNLSMTGKVRRMRENFFLDIHWQGERIRLYSDKEGYPLDSEKRAERLLAHIRYEIDHGLFEPKNYVKRELKALTWPNYLDAWIERQEARREAGEISREYVRMIKSLARNHIRAMFGSRSIRDLNKGVIDDAFVGLPPHLSTKTKYNIRGIISKVLRDAFDRQDIARIPKISRITVADPRTTYIEADLQERVLAEVRQPVMRAFFRFCMMHGCRPGEARALMWPDINGGYVTIAAAMDQNHYRPTTKEKDVRVLPMHADCLKEIEALPRALNGYVFTLRGRPLRKEYVNAQWRQAATRAGVNINCYQGTRHSLISQLLNDGYSEALVRQIAGHRCESTIQRYRHIKAESLRPLIERRDRLQTVRQEENNKGNLLIFESKKQ